MPRTCATPLPSSSTPLHALPHASSTTLSTPAARSAAAAVEGPELNPPLCIFKKYTFTTDPPPETKYIFGKVPTCEPDLLESVLLRPTARR